MSDSHDNRLSLKKAVCVFNRRGCDLVIHVGDFVAPFAAKELMDLDCPVKAVFGNCDGEKKGLRNALQGFGEIGEAPQTFYHENIKFVLTHVHTGLNSLIKKTKPDILIFGHTHKPSIERKGNTWVINPGETGGWLSGKSTVAVLDPEQMHSEILTL